MKEKHICFTEDPDIFHSTPRSPEQTLVIAILHRCIKDLLEQDLKIRNEAIAFVTSDATEDDVLSFRWLCSEVNLSPDLIIKHVIEYKDVGTTASALLGLMNNR